MCKKQLAPSDAISVRLTVLLRRLVGIEEEEARFCPKGDKSGERARSTSACLMKGDGEDPRAFWVFTLIAIFSIVGEMNRSATDSWILKRCKLKLFTTDWKLQNILETSWLYE